MSTTHGEREATATAASLLDWMRPVIRAMDLAISAAPRTLFSQDAVDGARDFRNSLDSRLTAMFVST